MSLPRAAILLLLAAGAAGRASAQESPLERYVRMGLESNRDLARQELGTLQAEASWSEGRSGYLPTVELGARLSWAEGGRTFDVPVGELLNPVYSSLNDLTGSQQFPTIPNQRFPLLRGREQETRVRVTQVLFNPAVANSARSRRFELEAARAGTEASRRALVRDIRIAYYQYANATRAETILEAALEMVQENERSSTALWQSSLATRDQVHRATAERLEVEGQLARAGADRHLAGSYLNYLLAREPGAPIEVSEEDLGLPTAGRLGELRRAATTSRPEAFVDALAAQAAAQRSELDQLDHAVTAAEAGLDAVRWTARPSVAVSVDAGIQGSDYGFTDRHRYALASLILSWNVFSGGAVRARSRSAELEVERLATQRDDVAASIRLELESAARYARVALTTLETAAERVRESDRAFLLVRRRRDEGLATELELLDARAALTRAQLSQSVRETEALIRLTELDYAAGALPAVSATPADTDREDER